MSVSLSSLGEAASVSDGSERSWQSNVARSVTGRGHFQMLIYPPKSASNAQDMELYGLYSSAMNLYRRKIYLSTLGYRTIYPKVSSSLLGASFVTWNPYDTEPQISQVAFESF